MRTIAKILSLSALVAFISTSLPTIAAEAKPPLVQIALLLDTSNSMDGLIAQAKSQLWQIVNEFINAKQNGQRPELQIALYEYGNNRLPASEGYIRQVQLLTTDLDKISEELFKLKTFGGQEYCGQVIKVAVDNLAWSKSASDFKAIFIAGNEPFTQGPVPYASACKAAIEKGIIVNTIHCGDEQTGIGGQWKDGALLAEGKYMFIDQNTSVVHYDAPQDKEIARLSEELNKTYIAYGAFGREYQARQFAQDVNAKNFSSQGSVVQRALSKASANYRNGQWDLVDASKEGKVKLEALKPEELPKEMQQMKESERKAYVEQKAAERENIQVQINRLNAERSTYVAEAMKKQNATNTLDTVVGKAVREQAARKNIQF